MAGIGAGVPSAGSPQWKVQLRRLSVIGWMVLCLSCGQPERLKDEVTGESRMEDQTRPGYCTLMVLRHAEKGSGADPDLTEEGHQRAEALAQLLAGQPVHRLLCTEYRRTRQTLEPLSSKVGVEIETIQASDAPAWREAMARIGAEECVVICGHQNTVPLFVEEVGGSIGGTERVSGQNWIPGHVFDRLYISCWPAGDPLPSSAVVTQEVQYGIECN
ncbi:MAG: phosphoglycerate mutase family protein [Planctomycetota bacterium]|nr:phosphoglycerate mutase family protein [Planctomycetota bacterium]